MALKPHQIKSIAAACAQGIETIPTASLADVTALEKMLDHVREAATHRRWNLEGDAKHPDGVDKALTKALGAAYME